MALYPFGAAIFDMDGTLLHNMPLHFQAFAAFAERCGLRLPPPDVAASLIGRRNSEIMPILFGRALTAEEIDRFSEEKERIYRDMLAGARPLPGLVRLLDALDRRGVITALATSAPPGNVGPTLAELGLVGRFATVTLGSEVAHGKPAPDIFLETARRLGQPAERCIVFEDSYAGITAARAAGMRCVALATTHSADELRIACAPDLIVRDFNEFLRIVPELDAIPFK